VTEPARKPRTPRPPSRLLILGLILVAVSIPQRILSDNTPTTVVALAVAVIGCVTIARYIHDTVTWMTERWALVPTSEPEVNRADR